MFARDARALPAVAIGPQAPSLAVTGHVPPSFGSATSPWSSAPPTPIHTYAASVKLWEAHVAAALPWLRAHDEGVHALPPLGRPELLLGVGVLVEPRDHADTEFVLRNWAHFRARQGWGLIIVHGTKNEAFMRGLTKGWPHVGYINSGVDNLVLPDYQRYVTDAAFWRPLLRFDRVVMLQTDTAQLSEESLTPFLHYDYVGAPWANRCCVCRAALLPLPQTPAQTGSVADGGGLTDGCGLMDGCGLTDGCGHMIDHKALLRLAPNLVGNGGLSLRNPRVSMEACLRYRLPSTVDKEGEAREPIPNVTNEDTFFCVAFTLMGAKVAPREVAARFAIEQVKPLVLDPRVPAATGIHKPWAYQLPDVMRCILAGAKYVGADGTPFWPTRM